jgi:hypothetical protein
MSRLYVDDNFGVWEDMDNPENREFYQKVQKTSVRKRCQGCRRMVRILPHYAYCDACATKLENGWDIDY